MAIGDQYFQSVNEISKFLLKQNIQKIRQINTNEDFTTEKTDQLRQEILNLLALNQHWEKSLGVATQSNNISTKLKLKCQNTLEKYHRFDKILDQFLKKTQKPLSYWELIIQNLYYYSGLSQS